MTLKAISIGVNSYQNLVETDRALVDSLAGQLPGVLLSPGVAMSAITDLRVTAGTGHTVNVGAGKAVVREKTTPLVRGAYFFQADAIEASVALPVPDTQPFYAAVVARVTDPQYGTVTGNVGARIDVIKGTPAASPVVVPDATIDAVTNTPGGWIRLADVRINTGDTGAIPSGQITDTRKPSGWGLIKCLSTNRPTGVSGLQIYEYDTKAWGVYDGANWVMWDSAWRPWTPAWPNVTLGNGVSTGAWRYVGDQIEFWAKLVRGSTTSFGAGSGMTLPATAASTDAFTQLDAAGIQAGNNDVAICASPLLLSLTAVTFTVWNTAGAYLIGGGYISNTAPHAWAAGDAILVRGRYRPA